jgi:hypothetical protein
MPMELSRLTEQTESIIRESISSVSGHEWDEDFITLNLLRDLRRSLSGAEFIGSDRRSSIKWQPYKLKGTHETNFGDIALVININYKDGTELHGVAFLEAKKRDWRRTSFGSMKIPQAKKILKNAPRSQYLLYDYEEISNFLLGSLYSEELHRHWHRSHTTTAVSTVTRAVCVPINLALATGYQDTLLYRNGLPLSLMLTNRYFQGLDLEFDDTSKGVATGFLNKFGLPKYIVKINITENNSRPGDLDLSVNLNNYTSIE